MLRALLVAAALLTWEPVPTLTLLWYPDGLLVRWGGPYGCIRTVREDEIIGTVGCGVAGEVFVTDAMPGDALRYYVGVEEFAIEKPILPPHYVRLPLVVEAP